MTLAEPRISIVVTCHDYGHFLGSCLDSLLVQTRPAAEIVVVDDGSADGTARLLETYRGQITALHTANSGQAAAFNVGFAASAGELVLFVDADDTLHPEAIETLRQHWSDDLAVLGFGLETIDAAGRSTGVYAGSVEGLRGDMRPRLLAAGTFAFSPTTGNLYARRCLDAVLPMPEPRWRISADCYLIRAAALFGRFGHVPHILGGYRLHGANNYAAADLGYTDPSRHRANQRDNADALTMLAERAATFATGPDEATALRFALEDRAEGLRADAAGVPGAGRRQYAFREAALRRDPALGTAVRRLAIPRWPGHLPSGRRIDPASTSWRDLFVPSGGLAPGVVAALAFTVDPAAEAQILMVELEASGADDLNAPQLSINLDSCLAWRGRARPSQEVRLALPALSWETERTVIVEVRREDAGRAPIAASVVALTLSASAEARGWPLPPDDGLAPAASLAPGFDPDDWDLGDSRGGAILRGRSAVLRLTAQEAGTLDLLLDFGAAPPRVWLTLREGAITLFTGRLGDARSIAVRLPPADPLGRHTLTLQVEGAAAEAGLALRLASVGLRAWRGLSLDGIADPARAPAAPLNLGQTVQLSAQLQSGLLQDGWAPAGTLPPRCAATEATIALRLPGGARALTLGLVVAPLLPAVPRLRHLLAASLDGELLAAVELVGTGTVDIPLPDTAAGREIRIGLHSTYLREDAGPDPGSQRMAPFELRSLTLSGVERDTHRPHPTTTESGEPQVRALLSAAGRLLAADEPVTAHEHRLAAARLRADLTEVLTACADTALLLFASSRGGVERLIALGAAARPTPVTDPELAALDRRAPIVTSDTRAAMRSTLLALLHHPAYSGPVPPCLQALPAPLLATPVALADYFAAVPDLDNAAVHTAWRTYLEALLESIDEVLARDDAESARFRLAVAILTRLRSTPTIFGAGPVRDLVRRHGRCVERLLVRQGARLSLARRPPRVAGRLRLGVLVRDVLPTPEGWALLGMYAGLDAGRFEATLIRMERGEGALDTGGRFVEELCLADLGLEESVTAIRALDLDLFVTGAYANGWEKATAILAHRLARVQIWATAVCPTTSGLGSFDVALSCRAGEPDVPERHYVEPLAWIDGPLQAAYAFTSGDRAPTAEVRAALGVPDGSLMLVTGALAHKISDELLAAWAAVLREAPDAVLMLYPFAANWSLAFDHERFRERLHRALSAAGVAPKRAMLLLTQLPERVRDILAAADLYLDSLPYTGATTVCEALASGTPVLTCAGDALRQLTGAAWVRAFGLPDMVATSPEAYVDLACRLCIEPDRLSAVRARLADRLAAGPAPHHDPAAFGSAFSDALWRIALESGLFPVLPGAVPAAEPRPLAPSDVARRPRGVPLTAIAAAPPVRLAILASARTGSTMLCDLLNQTPGVVCHYELFHGEMAQFVDRVVTDPDTLRDRDADPLGFLDKVCAEVARDRQRLVGFKLLAYHNPAVTHAVVADPTFRIIHLARENLLAQYSSERIALADGQWFARRGTPPEPTRMTFDADDFEFWEDRQRKVERERLALYAAHGRAVMFLDYRTISSPKTPERLGRFLGIPLAAGGTSSFHRRNSPLVLERFTNPEAVTAYLERHGLLRWASTG